MNIYVFALIGAGVVLVATLVAYFGFWRAGKSDGAASANATQAQTDLAKTKKADAVVMTDKPAADVIKSLNDGTF